MGRKGWGRCEVEGGLYHPLVQRQSHCIFSNLSTETAWMVVGNSLCIPYAALLMHLSVAPHTL